MTLPAWPRLGARIAAGAITSLAVVIGCTDGRDVLAPPAPQVVPAYDWAASRLAEFNVPFPAVAKNECLKADVRKNSLGVFDGWNVTSRRAVAASRPVEDEREPITYQMWRFDRRGRLLVEARCRLAPGADAARASQDFFDGIGIRKELPEGLSQVIGLGTTCSRERDAWGDLTGSIICGSEICSNVWGAIRSRFGESSPQPVGSQVTVIGIYSCGGGGTLYLHSGGGAYYQPPSSGGGGGGGGGGAGDPCSGGGAGDSIWDEFRMGAFAGSCDTVQVAPSTLCFPRDRGVGVVDTVCYRPLNTIERNQVDSALKHMLLPAESIADAQARAECQAAATWIRALSSSIMGGKSNSGHTAAHDPVTGIIHVDPWILDSARVFLNDESTMHWNGSLARTLIHEAMHSLHPSISHGDYPYTTWPYSLTNDYFVETGNGLYRSPCIKW